jgi:hypothetical protein
MEFLMTYGWSVLIITVVIVALFQLGVFSPTNYTPKAQPGNCKVLRTGGFTNLEGTCSGVPPQSVAVFNGGSNALLISSISLPAETAISESMWVELSSPYSATGEADIFYDIGGNANYRLVTNPIFEPILTTANNYKSGAVTSVTPALGSWYNVVFTYNALAGSNNFQAYVNGAAATPTTLTGTVNSISGFEIGGTSPEPFYGEVADVQIYNTTLDASQVLLLYTKGIGAAPIAPQYVVGWWPLNGNANDYSGNNNNGGTTNVVYTSSWTGGYTPP